MYMPTGYSDPLTEYTALVEGVTIWDVACERQIEIVGPDAGRFLQMLTPRNISACQVNRCRYVILTDNNGGIVNDAVLMRLAEDRYWVSPGDGDAILWIQGVAACVDMDVKVFEADASPIQLQGPKAPAVAYKLFGELAYELGYFHMAHTELDGIPLIISRTGWSGELGYELYLQDGSRGNDLWERVWQAGEEFDIKAIAPNSIRSIEGHLLSFASDIRREDNPFTLGLDRFVDLDMETDFIGKAALKKIKSEGVQRKLVGVEIEGEPINGNDAFWTVLDGDKKVGHISRCGFSPRLQKNIGFANVPIEYAEPGSQLSIATPVGLEAATVVSVPWFPAEKVFNRHQQGFSASTGSLAR
jgi:aminomethyltransferase